MGSATEARTAGRSCRWPAGIAEVEWLNAEGGGVVEDEHAPAAPVGVYVESRALVEKGSERNHRLPTASGWSETTG